MEKKFVKQHSAVRDFKYIGKQDFKIPQQTGEQAKLHVLLVSNMFYTPAEIIRYMTASEEIHGYREDNL